MSFDLEKYGEELKEEVKKGNLDPDEAERLYLEAKERLEAAKLEEEAAEKNLEAEREKKKNISSAEAYKRLKEHSVKFGLSVSNSLKNQVKEFNPLSLLLFITLFLWFYISEIVQHGLNYSFTIPRLSYVIFFLIFGYILLRPDEDERRAMVFLAMENILLPVFISYVYIMSKRSSFIYLDDLIYIFYALFTPGVLWWFYVYRRTEILPEKVRKFSEYAIPITIILLVFSGLSPIIAQTNNIQAKDTGFDYNKFGSSFSKSLSEGVKNLFFINSNKECSGFSCVSDWFNKNFVEPFQYNPTKVDDITNLDLGIYIRDLNIPSEINVDPFAPGEFVVPPIKFYLESPIDSRVWSSICSNNDVLGNVCDEKVYFYCDVESSDTEVEPSEDTFYNVVASKKKFVVCNIYRPLSVGSKKVNVSIVYPFVTNTFKILRLVDADYLRNNPEDNVLEVLDSDNSKLIVSNGGPVIVSSSEDKYILVSDNTNIPILFSFKPTQDFKLKSIDNVILTLPKGIVFSDNNNVLCDFKIQNNNDDSDNNVNVDSKVTYYMSNTALEKLNSAVRNSNSDVGFSCTLKVNKDDLNFEGYSFVEKSLNLVTKYHVVEEKQGSIFFSGSSIADFNPKASYNPNSNNNLKGCVPYTFSNFPFSNVSLIDPLKGKGYFTSCYEYRKDVSPHNHLALDIGTGQLSDPYIPVVSSTNGEVIFAGRDNTGYGNLVTVKSKVGENDGKEFYVITLYGHLSKINVHRGDKVNQGEEIGSVGSTGNSNGPHLHFEVRLLVRDKNSGEEYYSTINPLYFNENIGSVRNSKVNSYANSKQCYANFNYVIDNNNFVCKEDAYPFLAEKTPSDSIIKKVVYEEFDYRNVDRTITDEFYNAIVSSSECKRLRPSFIVGVAVAETSLKNIVCDNNYFNIKYNSGRQYQDGSCDNGFAKYSSVENSVRDFCSLMVNNYVPRNQDTVDKLVIGDYLYNADENHEPWLNNIKSIMDKYAVYGV